MPTTLVLLIFSWIIASLGLITSGYLIILKPGGVKSLIIALSILLGSLLLAVIVRAMANIGQILFDLLGAIKESSYSFSKDFQNLKTHLQNLNQDLKTQLQTQTTSLTQPLKETKDILQNLNQDLKTQLQAQTSSLTQLLKETQDILLNLNQDLKTQLQTQTNNLTSELQLLKSSLEELSCDSEDISQNIYQIKNCLDQITVFFEQIERHLDLKK